MNSQEVEVKTHSQVHVAVFNEQSLEALLFSFRKYGPHQSLESNYPLEPQNANALLSPLEMSKLL